MRSSDHAKRKIRHSISSPLGFKSSQILPSARKTISPLPYSVIRAVSPPKIKKDLSDVIFFTDLDDTLTHTEWDEKGNPATPKSKIQVDGAIQFLYDLKKAGAKVAIITHAVHRKEQPYDKATYVINELARINGEGINLDALVSLDEVVIHLIGNRDNHLCPAERNYNMLKKNHNVKEDSEMLDIIRRVVGKGNNSLMAELAFAQMGIKVHDKSTANLKIFMAGDAHTDLTFMHYTRDCILYKTGKAPNVYPIHVNVVNLKENLLNDVDTAISELSKLPTPISTHKVKKFSEIYEFINNMAELKDKPLASKLRADASGWGCVIS